MRNRLWAVRAATLLVLNAGLAPARAQLLTAQASGNASFQSAVTATTAPLTQTNSGSNANGSTAANATAYFGSLVAHGEAQTANLNSGQIMFGFGVASWQDTLTIDASGLTGTTGALTFHFTVNGSLTSTQGGAALAGQIGLARVTVDFYAGNVASTPLYSVTQTAKADGSSTGSLLGVEQSITYSFTFGTPFDFKLGTTAYGSAYTSFGGSSSADATASWGGIASVVDAVSAPVASFTATSASGANFASVIAIPEPASTAAAMSAGLLAITLAVRNRRRALGVASR